MGRALRLLQVLGVNSVPAFGVFVNDWSASTALALYWCENVLLTLLVAMRIWLHRRATRKKGHWEASLQKGRKPMRGTSTFLGSFLAVALVFGGAHGLFLSLILFLAIPEMHPGAGGIDTASLLGGLAVVALFLGIGFAYDLIGIGERRFYWVKRLADRLLGRVIVVHVTIIFGMWAMAVFRGPMALFVVFAVFKTLTDFTAMLGGGRQADEGPPGCLSAPIRALGGRDKAAEFERHYADGLEKERRERESWEEPLT